MANKIRNSNCTMCKLHKTAEFVCLIGQGPTPCDIMIVGEAPGRREDDSGKAFVGRSGKYLESCLNEVGIDREDVFITNAVHCRPPSNRTPTGAEIRTCKYYLDQEIKLVKPRFVLTLGNTPLQSFTGGGGIRKLRGKPIEQNGTIILPTFHPASIGYNPENEHYFKRDLRKFKELIDFGGVPYERSINPIVVNSWPKVHEMLDDLSGTVSCDTETSGLYCWSPGAYIVSFGFGTARNQWIIPVKADAWKCPWSHKELVNIIDLIDEKLQDCILVGHNWKFDRAWLRKYFNVNWRCEFDTMLAHYAIDENKRHSLDEISKHEFGAPDWDVSLELKQGLKGKFDDHVLYLAQDLYYTRALKSKLQKQLDKDPDVKRVFQKIIMPTADMMFDAEWRGVPINVKKMDDAEKYLKEELRKAEKELIEYGQINWGSPKQIGELLYGELGIKCPQKTPKGKPSTSESTLNQIDHPCVGALFRYRGAKQQLSFFIEGWKPYLINNRLHPSFKVHGTVTGRLSCENPNLMQVPRDPRIRALIDPQVDESGYELIEADLSQIELRIAADVANERNLKRAFSKGTDAHWLTLMNELRRGNAQTKLVMDTAEKITGQKLKFGESIEALLKAGPEPAQEMHVEWKELRKKAKAVNFGYLFGMWWKKFKIYARDNYGVNVTDEEAQESRKAFFDLYPDFPEWHKQQQRFAHEYGYVKSLSGRKRRLPDAMHWDDTPARAEAQRQAINSPVQSFANELNLMSAIQLTKEFRPPILYLIGTVHDAVLLEVRKEYVPVVYERILQIMQHPDMLDDFGIKLSVPIEAEAKVGPWSLGTKLEKWMAVRSMEKFQK
jgi:uracil-DNA glycosylase family 4